MLLLDQHAIWISTTVDQRTTRFRLGDISRFDYLDTDSGLLTIYPMSGLSWTILGPESKRIYKLLCQRIDDESARGAP